MLIATNNQTTPEVAINLHLHSTTTSQRIGLYQLWSCETTHIYKSSVVDPGEMHKFLLLFVFKRPLIWKRSRECYAVKYGKVGSSTQNCVVALVNR